LLFSATPDAAVDFVVDRYLSNRVVSGGPSPGPASSVMHVSVTEQLPVLIDLTSTPGRKVVLTRTKHRTRLLAPAN
jgi:hypothetical protein